MTTDTKPALPPLPAPTHSAYGLHYSALDIDTYGQTCEEHGYQRGLEAAKQVCITNANDYGVYRDHFGHRDGSKQCADDIGKLAAHLTEQAAPADPMDWPLPCDVKVGCGTHGKGTALRGLVARMQRLYDAMREKDDKEAAPVQEAQALDDIPVSKQPLSAQLANWRSDRPDEWTMDEFIRAAKAIESALTSLQPVREPLTDEPKAYMRKWAFDGEKPVKSKGANGRLSWGKFRLLPITEARIFPDDVPLVAILASQDKP